jgi:hypothetical protein
MCRNLVAIPTELAIDSRHTPCIGCETRKRIENKFHTNRAERSFQGAKVPSLLRVGAGITGSNG